MPERQVREGTRKALGVGETISWQALERFAQRRVDVGRDGLSRRGRGNRIALQNPTEYGLGSVPYVRRLSDKHFVQHCSESVDVACRTDRLITRGLLRAHVVRCAHAQAGLGQSGTARGAHC